MSLKRSAAYLVLAALPCWSSGCAWRTPATVDAGSPPPGPPTAETRASDHDLLEQVGRRLRAVMDPLPDRVLTPTFELADDEQVNAFATARLVGEGKDAKVQPRVVVMGGLMQRVIRGAEDADGEADRLAFIVSHELGHVVLAHIVRPTPGETPLVRQVFGRRQETDADLKGMELALKAGYSFRRGRAAIDRMMRLGLTYSSFEGLGADHPSWNDRLARLDKDQARLWKAMSAFQNGVFFLLVEQHGSAETCFREVIREFPDCYEAWANLGDALLMQYADQLSSSDLRGLGVGQLAVGGFYERPESLQARVRGADKALWNDAVEALQKGLALKPDLALARANLGTAYLVAPNGQDVEQATRYLGDAAREAAADGTLSPLMRAAVCVNAAAADLAAGRREDGAAHLQKAAELARELGSGPQPRIALSLAGAFLYNRAVLLAAGDKASQREAVGAWEEYLKQTNPISRWWPLAYDRYARLSRELGLPVKERGKLADPGQVVLRPLTGVKLRPGVTVSLSEPVRDVQRRLGEGDRIPVARGTSLVCVRYPDYGLELLCSDQVLAIRLRGSKAPALALQGVGPGGGSRELRPGMARGELEKGVGSRPYDLRQLDRPDETYRFYPELGVAVRVQGDSVEELVLAQVPRKAAPGGP